MAYKNTPYTKKNKTKKLAQLILKGYWDHLNKGTSHFMWRGKKKKKEYLIVKINIQPYCWFIL